MKKIHLVLDNLNTHKNYDADWYEQYHMFTFNFTPTSASWINLIESFFGNLTRNLLLKGLLGKIKTTLKLVFRILLTTITIGRNSLLSGVLMYNITLIKDCTL